MGRVLRITTVAVAALSLAGCVSSAPKIAEVAQVNAEQRAALTATEGSGEGGGGEAAGGGGATWVAIDIDYEAAPQELAAGEAQVELQNNGAVEHNVVIEELDDRKILDAVGGETDSATVNLEPGTYTYYCDVAGHRATMEGTLTVTE